MKNFTRALTLSSIALALGLCLASCNDEGGLPVTDYYLNRSVIGEVAAGNYGRNIEVPAIQDRSMYVVHSVIKDGKEDVTFSLEWDKANRTQRWSAYTITKKTITKGWDRSNWNGAVWKGTVWNGDPFQEDSIIPSQYRTTLYDHRSNGYDRGHIVNSNDRLMCKEANGQTYYLSNIQPQLNGFNAGVWLNMENKVHSWGAALSAQEVMYVVKGGTTQKTSKVPQPFLSDPNCRVPVPAYFWMAIVKKDYYGRLTGIAFWAQHKVDRSTNLSSYQITIDELESRIGIDLFPNLPDAEEKEVEKTISIKL